MAKILKHGNTYCPKTIICSGCNCEFQTENPEDEKKCPECGASISMKQISQVILPMEKTLREQEDWKAYQDHRRINFHEGYGWDDDEDH